MSVLLVSGYSCKMKKTYIGLLICLNYVYTGFIVTKNSYVSKRKETTQQKSHMQKIYARKLNSNYSPN